MSGALAPLIRARRGVQLALLRTHRVQLLILRQQAATDTTPTALVRCEAQLALVEADISALRWSRP